MSARTILLVEDTRLVREMVKDELEEGGYTVVGVESAEEGLERLALGDVHLLISDLVLPGMDGRALLAAVRRQYPDVPVIIMSGVEKSAEAAEAAIREGAINYMIKPLKPGEARFSAERALSHLELEERVSELTRQVSERHSFSNIVGRNAAMQKIYDTIEVVAETDATVLITGETGTGKEMVARAIHFNSPRKDRRFVTINCGALPSELLESELFGHEKGSFTGAMRRKIGKFEFADGGTVFLDEVGEIPLPLQVKLLRFLQDREFERVGGNELLKSDVRIISATNRDLVQAIAQGIFREDLYYRLHVVPMHMPPLRERKEDIPVLAQHFLEKSNARLRKDVRSIAPEVLARMMRYDWPGNVRELENLVERATIMTRGRTIISIDVEESPAGAAAAAEGVSGSIAAPFDTLPLQQAVDSFEREYFSSLLARFAGNIGETAEFAGVNPRTLNRKMNQHGLDKKDFKRTITG